MTSTPGTTTGIAGHAEPGWGAVADAFRRNFDDYGDLGAACSVYYDGRAVVDLWGGIADKRSGRPWERDTVVGIMSTSKGVTAICANMLIDRGQLDPDAPVADYWPEFAAAGKGEIPVRWLLTHEAALPIYDAPLTLDEILAWDPVIHALEAQKPLWELGTAHMVHGVTQGHLVGEVVRRITGKTLGEYLATEVAAPLDVSIWCGLPESEEAKVSLFVSAPPESLSTAGGVPGRPEVRAMDGALAKHRAEGSLRFRALTLNGAAWPVTLVTDDGGGMNSRAIRAAEFPACGMVSDARSLARVYAATVGEVDGVRLLHPATVDAALVPRTVTPHFDPLPGEEDPPFGLGFQLPSRSMPGVGPRSFGTNGGGGSSGLADPDAGIGFGYVMNQMIGYMGFDPRRVGLMDAIAACLS